MTLHEKIVQLRSLGFDIKFDGGGSSLPMTYVGLRYHGNVGVKIENSKAFTPEQIGNEQFIVTEIDRLYDEMKIHAYAEKHYFLPDRD